MHWVFVLVLVASVCAHGASADPLDPLAFASGGAFPTGETTIDGDALAVGGTPWPNASVATQLGGPDLAIFAFDGGATGASTISFEGTRPVVLLFRGPASLTGSWIVRAGGGSGREPGEASQFGGGGGGFGGVGGAGSTGAGGASYGDLFTLLEAGSSGGGSNGLGAGIGGGVIEIGVIGQLDVSGLTIAADGEDGTVVMSDGTGAGSGGGVFLHGFDVRMNAATQIHSDGGDGGDAMLQFFGLDEGGGGGGGGRIAVLHNTNGAFTLGGAQLTVTGGAGGRTDVSVPSEAGFPGVVTVADALAIGVPEPSSSLFGISALVTLALVRSRRLKNRSRVAATRSLRPGAPDSLRHARATTLRRGRDA